MSKQTYIQTEKYVVEGKGMVMHVLNLGSEWRVGAFECILVVVEGREHWELG